jgi:hypothetical protein
MREPRNRIVQVSHFGGPEGLEVVEAPLPTAGRGEVRVRVLASSLNYTDVLIRRHLYCWSVNFSREFPDKYPAGRGRALTSGSRKHSGPARSAPSIRNTATVGLRPPRKDAGS